MAGALPFNRKERKNCEPTLHKAGCACGACLVNTLALLCLSCRSPGRCLVLIWLRTWTHACTRQQRQAQASKNERLDDREVA